MGAEVIIVGSTIPAYVMASGEDYWGAWLRNAEAMKQERQVEFFAAIETDGRGIEPFEPLLYRLECIGGNWWSFSLNDGNTEVTTGNRLRRITLGQNLVTRYTLDARASHLLFMAADCMPPADALPKLLDLHWPIVGGEVTTYCLSGEPVEVHPETGQRFGFPVQQHMATAAFILVREDLLKRIPWRYDLDTGETDDPCMYRDAKELGYPTLVRKDVIGQHFPPSIGAIETRGHDMRLHGMERVV